MKTKFGKKLLALFLAVVMSLSVLTGAFTAFAANNSPYHDDEIADQINALGWVELTDDQTAEAVLDYLDGVLGDLSLSFSFSLVGDLGLSGTIDSVSGLLDIISQVNDLLTNYDWLVNMAGDARNINLSDIGNLSYESVSSGYPACGKDYRANNSAKDILKTLFLLIYRNTSNWDGNKAVLKQVFTGQLNLGTLIQDIVGVDVWQALNDGLFSLLFDGGLPSGYQNNLIFNIVTRLITDYTDWFTEEEANNMYNQVEGYDLDTMLFRALSENLLQQINVQVTYPDGTNSRDLYEQGIKDPNLCYTADGNVYIFQYDEDADGTDDVNLSLEPDMNLFEFSYEALEVAWKTVLSPTLGLLNSAVKDYDWNYTEWYLAKGYDWNYEDVASNYADSYVQAWAQESGLDLAQVQQDLTYDRSVVDDPSYNWRDIDSTKLFNELRRSPLMVYYFEAETGPLNTNFKCTGTPNIDAFMETSYQNYTSILGAFNDFLVAAVKDFLPDYDAAALATTGNTTDASTIATTLVQNALKVVQYVADATDENILSAFYHNNTAEAVLSETNFEEAMIPFLIACLENNLPDLLGHIHTDKWDACKDAEGVAAVCLEEYLSYILPHLDYSAMITKDGEGYYDVSFETILAMCRDAVGYVMTQYVPVTDGNGNDWSIYDVATAQTYAQQLETKTDLLSLLNSVVVYYANEKGAGTLLGCVDTSGNCLITLSNSIWDNIDIIANKLMPVLGELQFGSDSKYGQFDSEDLIWNDIVLSVLDIGDTAGHEETNGGGITNFIYRLATIIGAPSISTKGIDLVAYDLVKDLLNGVLNARYSSQHNYNIDVVPDATGDALNHPFHSVIQRDVIGGQVGNDDDIGVLGRALMNIAEFGGILSFPDTIWKGAMFAAQAVASFVPAFAPQLKDYEVGDLELSSTESAVSSYDYGSPLDFDVTFENTGHGINRNVKNASGEWTQLDRSYIKIENFYYDKGSFSIGSYDTLIDPESSTTFTIQGSLGEGDFGGSNEAIVTFTVNYKIVDENGNPYDDEYDQTLTKRLFYYATTENDWYNLTYDSNQKSGFTEFWDPSNDGNTGTYSSQTPYIFNHKIGFIDAGKANLQYPNTVIVRTSQLANINYTVHIENNVDMASKSVDGMVASSTNPALGGDSYFAVTCDPSTGDIINTFYYDYYQNGQWVTNSPQTREQLLALMENDLTVEDYRFHVVCPYENIDSFTFGDGYTAGSHYADVNADGTYNAIYLPFGSNENYKTLIDNSQTNYNDVTCSSGISGIVLSFNKVTLERGADTTVPFLSWDQETNVGSAETTMNYRIIASNPRNFTMTITVADDSGEVETLNSVYKQALEFINSYSSTDVSNSDVYDYFYQAAMDGLAAQETPITTGNALEYGSAKAYLARYDSTTNPIGDIAYMPATSSIMENDAFSSVRAYENNGHYYVTRYEGTDGSYVYENMIFSNTKVADGNVTDTGDDVEISIGGTPQTLDVYTINGTDIKVVKVREPGQDTVAEWHLLNDIQYKREWQDLGSGSGELFADPYYVETSEQATDATGALLYNEVNFTYRDSSGMSTSSTDDDWQIKFANTSFSIIDDPDMRGIIAAATDKLEYAYQLVQEYLNVSYGTTLFQQVALVRSELNNADFEVISYENMAAAGRDAEALIQIDYYNDYYLVDEDGTRQLAFSALDSEAEDKLTEYNATNSTAYELSDFVAEVDLDQSEANSSATVFELREATRLFQIYLAGVEERGYIGDKLEEEISCAVNGKSNENKDKKDTSYLSVVVNTENNSYTVNDVTYTADNNPDGVTYTAESWSAFISALDAAVDAAVAGNSSYAYKESGIYQPANKDDYTLQVSDVYNIRKALMLAENGLTEAVAASGYTVSAYVGALANTNDANGTYATTGATVTINTDAGEISAVTDETGKFVLENVPNGTYEATITYKYGFPRTFTITVNGENVESTTMVGIVACDFNASGTVTVADFNIYNAAVNSLVGEENYDLGIDLNRSDSITVADYNIYSQFVNQTTDTISYADTVIQ